MVPDLADAAMLGYVRAAMDLSVQRGRMRWASGLVPQGALNEYGAPVAERLLRHCLPGIEAVVGRALLPAYGFWRLYERGAQLKRHLDREACEVSATMTIASEGADSGGWPIHLRDLGGDDVALAPPPGSAVLYQGFRVPHWREPLAGARQYQVFLHYVVAGGPFAGHAEDRVAIEAVDAAGPHL